MERARVVVVHPSPSMRSKLRASLRDQCDIVAEADRGDEGIALTRGCDAELLIVAADMQGTNGLNVTRSVRQLMPTTHVILLTDNEDEGQLFEAIRYGASAYLQEGATPEEILDTVTRVYTGQYVIDDSVLANPRLASRVLDAFRELSGAGRREASLFAPLSPREIEVLEHAARGSSNKVIARNMGISDQTVKNHLTSVMRKLQVNDRTQAVVYALQHGWINVEDV